MINRMRLSNRLFSSFGNLHTQEQNSTHSITTMNHVADQNCTVANRELQVAYMNVSPSTTLVVLKGPLEATTYETLINIGEALLSLKSNCLLIDMSEVSLLTNSGLIALNNLVRIMNGKASVDIDHGWLALHQMEMDFQAGLQPHVKLLSPQPQIMNLLMQSGMNQICEIFDDIDAALMRYGWIAKD